MIDQVPTLDLREYDNDRARFVSKVGEAYREFGFCGFSHHGIGSDAVEHAYEVFKGFFDLPVSTKKRYHQAGTGGARGYTGFGIEKAKDSEHPDLKEFWHIGRELPADHAHRDRMPANLWPDEVEGFRDHGYRLFTELDRLGRRVLRAMALHLGQEEHYFDDKVDEGNSILRAIHYPPIADSSVRSVRAAKHEDINLITLLIGSDEPGLEILRRDGQWIPVTTVPGAIVINIGDMLQRLSNHVFPSTTHRVINPPGPAARHSRFSIPFFLHPNADFLIDTLDTCISEDNPNRYPDPLSSHDYLMQRLLEIGLL